jgi:hypothetical protein
MCFASLENNQERERERERERKEYMCRGYEGGHICHMEAREWEGEQEEMSEWVSGWVASKAFGIVLWRQKKVEWDSRTNSDSNQWHFQYWNQIPLTSSAYRSSNIFNLIEISFIKEKSGNDKSSHVSLWTKGFFVTSSNTS